MKQFALIFVTLIAVAQLAPCQSLTLLSHQVHDPYETTVLQGPGDLTVTLISHGPLSRDQIDWLTSLYELGSELQVVRLRSVRVLIEGDEAEISVLPTEFRQNGYDLTNFLPSGIQLYYDGVLEYDFRLLVGHYFLRLKGAFVSDADLARTVLAAIQTPEDHLDADTSRRLNDRFSELTTELGTLRDNDAQQSKSIGKLQEDLGALQGATTPAAAGRIATLETSVATLGVTVAELQNQVSVSRTDIADLERLYQVLSADTASDDEDDGRDRLNGITKQYETVETDLETTRTALIALNNRRGRPVDPTTINRIVELKKANPALTKAEISKQLSSEGLSVSTREVSLVFSVYFAEF